MQRYDLDCPVHRCGLFRPASRAGFGRKVEDPAETVPTIREAIDANTVAVINVITDPKGGRRGSNYLG